MARFGMAVLSGIYGARDADGIPIGKYREIISLAHDIKSMSPAVLPGQLRMLESVKKGSKL